jgi:hypothetical protein
VETRPLPVPDSDPGTTFATGRYRISPDGRWFIAGKQDAAVEFVELTTAKSFRIDNSPFWSDISPAGNRIASSSGILNVPNGELLFELPGTGVYEAGKKELTSTYSWDGLKPVRLWEFSGAGWPPHCSA